MDIIKLEPYRRLSDQQLINEIHKIMSLINEYESLIDDCDCHTKIIVLDNLIKECKRREISLDNERLAKKIFNQSN